MNNRAVVVFYLFLFSIISAQAGEPHCACLRSGVVSRILGGVNVPASQFPTVGEVGDANDVFCTGTLIAPNVVLCAGHCAADDNGKQSLGDTAGRFTLGGAVYSTKKVVIHPSYKGFVGDQDGQFDVSVLILNTSVPNVTPTPMYRKTPAVGTVLTLAGFGELGTGAGGNGKYPADGTIETGTTTLESVTQSFLHWTFDQGESDTAPGDSGGPAFIEESGVRYIAGITSGGSGEGFNNVSYDTRVDAVAAWVDSVIAAQGPVTGGGTGGTSTLVTSGPNATPNPAEPNQTVQFSAVGASGVSLSWDFGDGTPIATGTSVQHAYSSEGSYTVMLTASKAGTNDTLTLNMMVTSNTPVEAVSASAIKKHFSLSFANPDRSHFEITLSSGDFIFEDRFDFEDNMLDATVDVLLGNQTYESLDIVGTNSVGDYGGKLNWNYKRGQLRYRGRGGLNDILDAYGATDETTQSAVTVPFYFRMDGTSYGGNYTFFYKARAGRTGTGK